MVELISLFDEIKAVEKPKKQNDIFAYLNSNYSKYKPHINNNNDYELTLSSKVKVIFAKRSGNAHCCEEFRNGYYSVSVQGSDWGCSMPTSDFEKACRNCDELIRKGLEKI